MSTSGTLPETQVRAMFDRIAGVNSFDESPYRPAMTSGSV